MCSKCSVVNYHTVLLAFALTVSPTASPKSSEKRASSRRPENGQRLAGNVGNSEVRPVGHAREIPDCSEQPTGLGYCPPRHCLAKIRGQGGSLEAHLRTQPCVPAGRSLVLWSSNIPCTNPNSTRFEHAGRSHTRNTRSEPVRG